MADGLECKPQCRRRDARAAGRDHRLGNIHTGRREHLPDALGINEAAVLD
jgi:hypothetical protein